MGKSTLLFLTLSLSLALAVPSTYGTEPFGNIEEGIIEKDGTLEGQWRGEQTWEGWPCQGSYSYDVQAWAVLKDLSLDLQEDSTLLVTGDIRDAHFRADGKYRSSKTLCVPVRLWSGMSSPRIEARARVILGEDPTGKDLKVQVLYTRFDTIDFGIKMPESWRVYFTRVINRGFEYLWASLVGDVIGEKLSEILKKKLDEARRA